LDGVTPEEMRKEASAAAFLARLISCRERDWLEAKAAALRHQADLQERRSARGRGALN
jgi:hypothetical protein